MARIYRLIPALSLLTLLVSTGHAYRRIHEEDGFLSKPVWGLTVGLGQFSPDDESSDGGLLLTTGLRYLRPDWDDRTWHAIGYEVTANSLSSSSVEVLTYDGGVYQFFPRRNAFSFDYHWFWGAGVGLAQVSLPSTPTVDTGIAFISGGLQGRVRDFFLEAKFKYSQAGPDATVSPGGATVLLTGTYYFLP